MWTNLLPGERAGSLIAVLVFIDPPSFVAWHCYECGAEGAGALADFRRGRCASCQFQAYRATRRSHGLTHTQEYNSWRAMKGRCYRRRDISYPYYGARGVRMCDRWRGRDGFQNFLNDVGQRPSPLHSIDRYPNPSGNYEPGNVRWALPEQQAVNHLPGWRKKALARRKQTHMRNRCHRLWSQRQTLYSAGDMAAILNEIRDDLTERFGNTVMPTPKPSDLSVESYYWDADIISVNCHTEDIGLDVPTELQPGWRFGRRAA